MNFNFGPAAEKEFQDHKEKSEVLKQEKEKNTQEERLSKFNNIQIGATLIYKNKSGEVVSDFIVETKNEQTMQFVSKPRSLGGVANYGETVLHVDQVLDYINPKE
jgi:ribosomal protein L15E